MKRCRLPVDDGEHGVCVVCGVCLSMGVGVVLVRLGER